MYPVWIRERNGECPDSYKSATQAWILSGSTGYACPSRGSRSDTTPRNAVSIGADLSAAFLTGRIDRVLTNTAARISRRDREACLARCQNADINSPSREFGAQAPPTPMCAPLAKC